MAAGGAQRNPWIGCVRSHLSAPQGRGRHPWPGTFTRLLYHVVFSTKHRANLIAPELQARLYDYLRGIVRGERGREVTRRSL